MSFLANLKYELQKRSMVTRLLVANLVLFFVINIGIHIVKFNAIPYLALPLNVTEFFFKFWTLLTYMFVHENLGHVFYNMLLFYFAAQTFTNFLPEKKLLQVYIMSGISGGIILMALSLAFPSVFSGTYLYGASAAVIGIITSLGMYLPNLPVNLFGIIEMKYKYYALLVFATFTIIDFTVNTGGKISHFGGAFFGLFYGYRLKHVKTLTFFSFFKKKRAQPLKVIHTNHAKQNPSDFNQQLIDELLDKISKNGYDSLSKSEKELLFKLSQKK